LLTILFILKEVNFFENFKCHPLVENLFPWFPNRIAYFVGAFMWVLLPAPVKCYAFDFRERIADLRTAFIWVLLPPPFCRPLQMLPHRWQFCLCALGAITNTNTNTNRETHTRTDTWRTPWQSKVSNVARRANKWLLVISSVKNIAGSSCRCRCTCSWKLERTKSGFACCQGDPATEAEVSG